MADDLIEDVVGSSADSFSYIDETHRVIDKRDLKDFRGILGWFLSLLFIYVILHSTIREQGLRTPIFDTETKTWGEFTPLLILRTLFIEYVIVPLLIMAVSTISSIVMQSRLARDSRISRGSIWNVARSFGCHFFDTIHTPRSSRFLRLRIIKEITEFESTGQRLLYRLRALMSKRHALYHVYKGGALYKEDESVESNKSVIVQRFGIFEEWLENDRYEKVKFDRDLMLINGGWIQGRKLLRRLET